MKPKPASGGTAPQRVSLAAARSRPLATLLGMLPAMLLAAPPAEVGSPSLRLSAGLLSPPVAAPATGPSPTGTAAGTVLREPQRWLPQTQVCATLSEDALLRLTLDDALAFSLCRSPSVRQAMLAIQEQTAGVELARLAYRPRLYFNSELAGNHTPSSNINAASDSSSVTSGFSLSWMLFDFGARDASLEQARQQLASVLQAQDSALLTVLNANLATYFDAATAWMRRDAMREAEDVARSSVQAAQAKYEAQVGSLAEKLQAQTALAQATLERVRADGTWQAARGSLAVAMGLAPDARLGMAELADAFPDTPAQGPTEELLVQAREVHPRLRGLRADVKALQARLGAVRASGWGSVNFSGSAYETRGLGAGSGNPVDRRLSGSVYVSIPLFNGSEVKAQADQAQAQIGNREAALEAAQREIETDIWKSAQQVQIEAQNADAARQLLNATQLGHQIALGRYKAGVGSMLELLTAQSALANARSQLNQAILATANAKIKLGTASGRLGGR